MDLFNYKKLNKIAKRLHDEFINNKPFPYIVIDNIANEKPLSLIESKFPQKGDLKWYTYDNPLERKLAFPHTDKMPKKIRSGLMELNSGEFITFLETLTGIKGIIPDPHFLGGGLHSSPPGYKLDAHVDFNINSNLGGVYRRINCILYLNKDWDESYGGNINIYEMDERGNNVKEWASVSPVFNRMLIFETSKYSLHGHPFPVTCPKGMSRKSLATYYYHTEPGNQAIEKHSTTFKALPGVEDGLDDLRLKRQKGRI